MQQHLKTLLAFLAILAIVILPTASATALETRLALVIGNAAYKAKPLATAVNDAALVGQTLQTARFDVIGARDLDEGLLRLTIREFTDRVAKAGPDAVAVVYFAGYGLQFEGENYLLPINAEFTEVSNIPARALRLSELTHALAALHARTTFLILDAARASPYVLPGEAGGFAWVEPEGNMLIAFNAAPGTSARDVRAGYGPFAKALVEMIREGNLTPAHLFDRVRLRVSELTNGAQVPWDASKIDTQFRFFERAADAPLRADGPERTARMRTQAMRSLGVQRAYMVALLRDTFDAYTDFLADYWQDPMTKRVRALLAARRESITWRRTCQANVPDAYWSYLERYPRGPHVADAGRLLTRLGAAITPPPKFARMDYDVPPPLPEELDYIERPMLVLDDPAFAFEPTPPTPVEFLEPVPAELVDLKPPAASSGAHTLPVLTSVPLPPYVRLHGEVVASTTSPISSDLPVTTFPAHDARANSDGRTVSPSSPPRAGDNQAGGAPRAPAADKPSPPPPILGEMARVEVKPDLTPATVPVSPKAQWFIDITTPADQRSLRSSAFTTDTGAVIPAPTLFAPASAGLILRTWNHGTQPLPAAVRVPLPIPRSVALAPLRHTASRTMAPPQTTGSIPPTPRSAAPAAGSPPNPIALLPSLTDQAKKPKTMPRAPNAQASGISAPKP